jgi:putative ABC transport system permease protein
MAGAASGKRWFRLPFSKATMERDIRDEIDFHIEMRVSELSARGVPAAEARERAAREFGDVSEAQRELATIGRLRLRRQRRTDILDAVRQDVGYALRGIRREPGFALAIVVTLALGIGANAAMFGILDRLLLRPPAGVADPARVVWLAFESTSPFTGEVNPTPVTTYPAYAALREAVSPVAELAVVAHGSAASFGAGDDAVSIRTAAASASLFSVLGVEPAAGRFFTDAEDAPPAGQELVVLSWGFWQGALGGRDDVLGSTVRIDARSWTVVGIAPRGFNGLDLTRVDAWLPVSIVAADEAGAGWHTENNMWWLRVVGRLRPGSGASEVAERATAAHASLFPWQYEEDAAARVSATPILGSALSGTGSGVREVKVSAWLVGVAGVVLLVGCANVANLLLARSIRRRREIGVRLAMGVGRARLALQMFTEILVFAVIGGLVGLVLAAWGGRVVQQALLPHVDWSGGITDTRVLLFALAATLLAAALSGGLPALLAGRIDLNTLLRSGSREGTYRRSTLRAALVVVQGALCVLLLVGAGLFVRSLRNAWSVDLGFDPARVLVVEWSPPALDRPVPERLALYDRALERLRGLPEVESAALSLAQPYWSSISTDITSAASDSVPRSAAGGPSYTAVTPGYFETMGMRIVRGRGFDEGDVASGPRVAVLHERTAAALFPGGDALGECVHVGEKSSPCSQVVGIAGDVRMHSVAGEPTLHFVLPLAQRQTTSTMRVLLVRTRGDPVRSIEAVRRAAQELEAGLPFVSVAPLSERIEPQLRPWRMGATLFSAFGGLALVLAALGLYAVLAYDVAQRRQEIGVRIALGAGGGNVVRLVLGNAVRFTLAGIGIGISAAALLAGSLEGELFRVSPRDPIVLGGVALVLLGVGMAAAVLPARRAMKVDPMASLKAE